MRYAELTDDERARLRAAFACGFSAGSGTAPRHSTDPELDALMDAVVDDYLVSLEWEDAPLMRDNVPGWLLSLARGESR
jgi:hypothetical protein